MNEATIILEAAYTKLLDWANSQNPTIKVLPFHHFKRRYGAIALDKPRAYSFDIWADDIAKREKLRIEMNIDESGGSCEYDF